MSPGETSPAWPRGPELGAPPPSDHSRMLCLAGHLAWSTLQPSAGGWGCGVWAGLGLSACKCVPEASGDANEN